MSAAFVRLRKNQTLIRTLPHLLGFRTIVSSPSTKVLETFTEQFEIGSRLITLQTSLHRLFNVEYPNGYVALWSDQTQVLSRVYSAKGDGIHDDLPLTVDYDESIFAQGLILATRMKRDFSCDRILDCNIRPLFPPGFYHKVQVCASVLSGDVKQDPVVLAANATSAALMVSDIPWDGPIGVIQIGRIHGQFIVNPTMDELCLSDLNLVYACTRDEPLTIIAQQGNNITRKDRFCFKTGSSRVKYIEHQLRLAAKAGKSKKEYKLSMLSEKVFTDPCLRKDLKIGSIVKGASQKS